LFSFLEARKESGQEFELFGGIFKGIMRNKIEERRDALSWKNGGLRKLYKTILV